MHSLPSQMARNALRGARHLLKSTRFGRNLLRDLNNSDEFTSLLSHERMLADRVRVDAYHEAIRRHVNPGDVVIDLGTGTGILALFAAQQQARTVYAIDHSDFIDVARRIAVHNGIDNIVFVRCNSREFVPDQPADLIVHEQIGDELFSENMLENLLDLKRRALKPGGRILPGRFDLFVEPARLKPDRQLPFLWERPVYGIDFAPVREDSDVLRYKPSDYDFYLLEPSAIDHWLGEPEPLLSFDLNEMNDPAELVRSATATRIVTRSGSMDGLAVYFRVIFDDATSFDTSPLHALTHWRSRLFRTPQRWCNEGDAIRYRFAMGDPADPHSWSVAVEPPRQPD